MIWTFAAVASWCLAAYMLPVVAAIVWLRRRRHNDAVIQKEDWPVTDDWLRTEDKP